MLPILMTIFFIVTVIFFTVTVILIVHNSRKLKYFSECEGEIVDFYVTRNSMSTNNGSNKAISPVVSYSVCGKKYSFRSGFYATSMKVGDKVKVLYDNDDPAKASLKTGLYIAPVISGVLSLFFFLFVAVYAVLVMNGFGPQ